MKAEISIFASEALSPDVRAFVDRVAHVPDVARVAVMPDVHLAGDACVGLVVATRGTLVPGWLGSDLGCGVAALALGVAASALRERVVAERALEALGRAIPTRIGALGALPDALRAPLSSARLTRVLETDAAAELGTLGRGNHFLELQADEDDALWLMVHTGSRALGPAIQAHHAASARRERGFATLDAESDAGRRYLADHDHALRYAAHNRALVARRAADVLADAIGAQPDASSWLECHHDVVRAEIHDGERLWVHRKGAVPAASGDPVLVPGSMGTESVHASGRGEPRSLASSAHGAGRLLTRTEARRRIDRTALAREMGEVVYDARLAGRLVDEAPSAYKDLRAVLRAERDLVRVVRRLRPLVVLKSG